MKDLLLSLEGRIGRKTYWMFYVATIALLLIAVFIDGALTGEDGESSAIVTLLASLAILWPSIAVSVKRWHDRGKSGWWVLINLIPGIGPIWALVENGFLAGTPGDNRFGPSPV